MNIDELELTAKDFRMLIEALDCLPGKGATGELLGGLMGSILAHTEEQRMAVQRKMEEREKLREEANAAMIEDIRLLQAKLIKLKRWFQEQNALKIG